MRLKPGKRRGADKRRLFLRPLDDDCFDVECGVEDGCTYLMHLSGVRGSVGYVSLRVGESPALYYLGHIGYRVDAVWRGAGLAERAVRMLAPELKRRGIRQLVITANPENIASRRTCEKLGCVLENIVPVPPEYRRLCMGAAKKCRYILETEQLEEAWTTTSCR